MSLAAGVLALLEEDDHALKAHALNKLRQVVDQYWAEIADAIPLIESLSDDDSFPHRDLAAFVASKVRPPFSLLQCRGQRTDALPVAVLLSP